MDKSILDPYFQRINYKRDGRIGIPQARQLFIEFMSDFLEYKIDIDDVDTMCELVHASLREDKNLRNSRIENVISHGLDLSWDIRNQPKSAAESLEYLIDKYNLLKDGKAL